jgi:hypothetical protein
VGAYRNRGKRPNKGHVGRSRRTVYGDLKQSKHAPADEADAYPELIELCNLSTDDESVAGRG